MASSSNFSKIFKVMHQLVKNIDFQGKSQEELLHEIYGKSKDVEAFKSDFTADARQRDQMLSYNSCVMVKDKAKNTFLKNQSFTAIKLYTHFLEISHDCSENSQNLLFQVNLFKECLEDIEAAFSYGSDPNTDYLLWDRKAKCLKELGEGDEARECYQKALTASAKAQMVEKVRELFQKQVRDSMDNTWAKDKNESGEKGSYFALDQKKNEHFPGLTAKGKIEYAGETLGRRIIAREDINPGEVILNEHSLLAFAQCDPKHETSKVCHHCLNSFRNDTEFYYPSDYVRGIRFCSWRCLQKAKEYHRYEALLIEEYLSNIREKMCDTFGCMFLAFRAVCKMPLKFFVEEYEEASSAFGCQEQVREGNPVEEYSFLSSLVGHSASVDESEKVKMAIRSVILVHSLLQMGYFPTNPRTSDIHLILRLLFNFQLTIAHNIHSVYHLEGPVSGDIPLTTVGSAVYRSFILINHSCANNTMRLFQGGRIIVIAQRFIHKGEEITTNYGPHHLRQSKNERQETLERSYKFTCSCQACEEDYPDLINMPDTLPTKGLKRQNDQLIGEYQRFFKAEQFREAFGTCVSLLQRLHYGQVAMPNKTYEVAAVAMESCAWAILQSEA